MNAHTVLYIIYINYCYPFPAADIPIDTKKDSKKLDPYCTKRYGSHDSYSDVHVLTLGFMMRLK